MTPFGAILTRVWLVLTFPIGVTSETKKMVASIYITPEVNATMPAPIIIGTALTLDHTAKYASLGGALRNSFEFYFEWLNNKHGGVLVGGVRRPVELLLIDDESDCTNVKAITTYLSDTRGVDLFLAPYSSGLTSCEAEVVASRGKTLIAAGSSSTSVYEGRPQVFGTLSPAGGWLVTSFEALQDASGGAALTVAYIQEDIKWAKGICSKVANLAPAHGMTLIQNITVPTNTGRDDMREAVTSLAATGADVLIGCVYRTACHNLLKEAKEQQYNPKAMVLTICVTEADFYQEMSSAGQNIIGMAPWTPDLPLSSSLTDLSNMDYVQGYQARTGGVPPYQAASAFASCAAMVHAIETADSTDPVLVADALRAMSKDTVYGLVSFDVNGQNKNPMKVVQIQNGVSKLVYPKASANADLIFPKPDLSAERCTNIEPTFQSRFGFTEAGECKECQTGRESVVKNGARRCEPCRKGFVKTPGNFLCVPIPEICGLASSEGGGGGGGGGGFLGATTTTAADTNAANGLTVVLPTMAVVAGIAYAAGL